LAPRSSKTRERRPPHYHVAIYPAAYRAYAAELMAAEAAEAAEAARAAEVARQDAAVPAPVVSSMSVLTPTPESARHGSGLAGLVASTLGLLGATVVRRRWLPVERMG
jgi:hypothetical protein